MPQSLSEFVREFNRGHGPEPRAVPIDWQREFSPGPVAREHDEQEPALFQSLRRIHESAHAVIGKVLGLRINFIDSRPGRSRCSISGPADGNGVARYLICLGAARAAQWKFGAVNDYYSHACSGDDEDIVTTARQMTSSSEEALELVAKVRKAADAAVREHWSDILWLASALERLDDRIDETEAPGILRHVGAEKKIIHRRGFIPSASDKFWTRKGLSAPRGFDAETREIDAVLSTGSRVRRVNWDGPFDEILGMNPENVRLARLNQGAAVLDSHNWYDGLNSMLGGIVPGSARLGNGELTARIKFSRGSSLAQRIAQDLRDGIQIPLSVGYKIHRQVEDKKTNPVTRTVTDLEPLEISLVTVAAEESGTGFRAAA
jgi:hypothetical protein